ADDALDFAGLVRVAALFANRVELIEEQDAWRGSRELENAPQPRSSLAKVTADDGFIPDDEERHGKAFGDCLGQRCLAIPRRADEQQPVSWLQRVRAQEASSLVFIGDLASHERSQVGQDLLKQPTSRSDL